LVQLLQSLPYTLLVSTHDLALAADVCSRAVVLNNGVVVYDGASEQLLDDQRLLAEYGLV
jgi:cobalt/nickel transport system ATP-binding protein